MKHICVHQGLSGRLKPAEMTANLIRLGHYWDQNVHHDLEDVLILWKSFNTFVWRQLPKVTSSFLFGCDTFS